MITLSTQSELDDAIAALPLRDGFRVLEESWVLVRDFTVRCRLTVNDHGRLMVNDDAWLTVSHTDRLIVNDYGLIVVNDHGRLVVNSNGLLTVKGNGRLIVNDYGLIVVNDHGRLVVNSDGGLDVNDTGQLAISETGWLVMNRYTKLAMTASAHVLVDGKPIAAGDDALKAIREIAPLALRPGALKMHIVHSCDMTHCLAGWACRVLPGGLDLESRHGWYTAALFLLGSDAASHFYDSDAEAQHWLRSMLAGQPTK